MLKLDKVSKFYSANGVVSAGFSKVSLDFDIGEFVAITGESGSGKSTLLNVISGLDSYEEGEMYIFDEPTSGYGSDEMEVYRKKYIGSIFQTFNLINNYTVYQNVELVLLLAGYKRSEIKARVDDIIRKVGLENYRNTKASKLSGGQKQRVAIARALAKETPIIVADEPTGNLDVASADGIIELLASLSKDKLILIVTHNYEQVEKYVTRKITMLDGKVIDDKKFDRSSAYETVGEDKAKEIVSEINVESGSGFKEARQGGLSFGNTLRLGTRNAFSLVAKFLLVFVVFLFLCMGTFFQYTSNINKNQQSGTTGYLYNAAFNNASTDRLVLTNADKSPITDEQLSRIENTSNLKEVVSSDLLIDLSFSITSIDMSNDDWEYGEDDIWMSPILADNEITEGRVEQGHLPTGDNEVFLLIMDEWYEDSLNKLLGKEMYISIEEDSTVKAQTVTLAGYGYFTDEEVEEYFASSLYYDAIAHISDETKASLEYGINQTKSTQYVNINDNKISTQNLPLLTSEYIEPGEVYIMDSQAELFPYSNISGKTLTINTKTTYWEREKEFDIAVALSSSNCEYWLGIKADDLQQGIYMNPEDFAALYKGDTYQVSVYVDNMILINETVEELENQGFDVLQISKTSADANSAYRRLEKSLNNISMFAVLIILFFICYFIIKLIYKSQNIYFSTVRMLGGNRRGCSGILITDMLIIFHIAFAVTLAFILAVKGGYIDKIGSIQDWMIIQQLKDLVLFVENKDFVVMYLIVLVMAILISVRYSSQMFKKTAMNAYREEV